MKGNGKAPVSEGNGRLGSSEGNRRPTARLDHEELLVRRGRRTGMYVIVAVHSTLLGPALGGARLWCYGTPGDAVADVLRLSEAMTLKAAAAGLDLGGGKAVMCADGELTAERRRGLLLDLGDLVESLDGRYITAEDVGTGTEDMAVIQEKTSHVVGLPPALGGSGDPSPLTARGVEAAIRACCERRFDSPDLSGRNVCVIGIGHVGARLVERLVAAGCRVTATDIDPGKRVTAEQLGALWIDPDSAITAACEVLAPCALGGVIDAGNVDELRCEILCGSANNILADESLADRLHERGIVYAPDFIANAGGLINVYAELHSLDRARTKHLVDGIGETIAHLLTEADERGATPLEAARQLAAERLERARRREPAAA